MTRRYFIWLFNGFLLVVAPFGYGQNLELADSLIRTLRVDELTQNERFEILRKIAHNHPDYVTALGYAHQSLELAQELEEPLLEAKAYEEIGLNERLLGNQAKSLEATLRALKIFERLGENVSKAAIYAQLGTNSVSDGAYRQAIDYFQEARKIYQPTNQTFNYALTILNLGEAYRLAMVPDSAIHYFHLALALNEHLHHRIVESYALGNLGMAYNSIGRLSEAKEKLLQAIVLVRDLGDPYSTSIYLAELGQIYLKEGLSDLAEETFLEAYHLALNEGLKEQVRDFSKELVQHYERFSEYDQAFKFQKIFQVYQDSLVNRTNIRQIEQLKAGYEIEKRESEIALLNRINTHQKYLAAGLTSGIFIFIILSFLLYRSNQHKKKINVQLSTQKEVISRREEEKALLLQELNHRVKNNLQMISSLLNLQENELIGHPAEEAINASRSRVEALSLIHQKLYREDLHTQINVQEYVEELVLNLFYSYGSKFHPELTIAPITIDIDLAIPMALILNELVTNSLKYAYRDIAQPAMKISLIEMNQQLRMEVADNGTGFSLADEKSTSFGIKLVRSLVEQMEGSVELETQQGTHWTIAINFA